MSYCRWSTDIKNAVPTNELLFLLRNGVPYDYIKKLEHRRHAEYSDWYIFWHCNSGTEKEDQILALWNKEQSPLFAYEDVKRMYDDDDWSYFDNLTQKEFMKSCVKEWLEDVENDE